MNKQEMIKLMTPKGFELHSHSGNGMMYDFIKGDINCRVFDSGEFEFALVTNNMATLSSGKASPVTNELHFNKMYNKFMKDAKRFLESD